MNTVNKIIRFLVFLTTYYPQKHFLSAFVVIFFDIKKNGGERRALFYPRRTIHIHIIFIYILYTHAHTHAHAHYRRAP